MEENENENDDRIGGGGGGGGGGGNNDLFCCCLSLFQALCWGDSSSSLSPGAPRDPEVEIRTTTSTMEVGSSAGLLQKFLLYEARSKYYLVGRNKNKTLWRVLEIDRWDLSNLSICEDPRLYSKREFHDLMEQKHAENQPNGGFKLVTKCYGIVGFIKFLGPYYMLLITKRRKIGTICGHAVFAISKSEIITVQNPVLWSTMPNSKDENRYKRLLCTIDLTKGFFFSYSYDIMHSLEKNLSKGETGQVFNDSMFVWNEFLTSGIRNHLKNTTWTVSLVYGFFKQSRLPVSGKHFMFTLIARRSRYFAGTRYLKRGVNEKGRVANDVETEQIVFEDKVGEIPPQITSVVQNRGSIPLYWSQETSAHIFRQNIIIHGKDPNYNATQRHFDDLAKRYGKPITILDLNKRIEKKPRESLLSTEYECAVCYLNNNSSEEDRLKFLQWDLNMHYKKERRDVLESLGKVVADPLDRMGFFYCQINPNSRTQNVLREDTVENFGTHEEHALENKVITNGNYLVKPLKFQRGVLRTNCIDCLDRTNVAQYAYGLAALGRQLHVLKLLDVPNIGLDSPLARYLMDFYQGMGDALALQYVGSSAHNKIFASRKDQCPLITKYCGLIRNFERYYSNAFTDGAKQDAINLFLGYFRPQQGKPALWPLDSDQLYNIRRQGHAFTDENGRSSMKRAVSEGNIRCESSIPLSISNVGQTELHNSLLPQRMNQPLDVTRRSKSASESDSSHGWSSDEIPGENTMWEDRGLDPNGSSFAPVWDTREKEISNRAVPSIMTESEDIKEPLSKPEISTVESVIHGSRSSTNWIHKQEATCDGSIREVICDAGEKEIINSAVPEMMESEYIRDSLGSTPEISMTESALYERHFSPYSPDNYEIKEQRTDKSNFQDLDWSSESSSNEETLDRHAFPDSSYRISSEAEFRKSNFVDLRWLTSGNSSEEENSAREETDVDE
ncbi:phosphoinositide phosphatase SAC2-like isoform X3 [Ananas comosus]|uniref:Phosphoinositide phosphatase SAC2-like isoform X3 n=1 Tax=Ananas comosus TaxID=4615 RepID=A0A6P5GFB3_ANACO|nr:phosphoinositide phosphatase SAC2-like isoform X3 [Ananas comosus]